MEVRGKPSERSKYLKSFSLRTFASLKARSKSQAPFAPGPAASTLAALCSAEPGVRTRRWPPRGPEAATDATRDTLPSHGTMPACLRALAVAQSSRGSG
eukprot:CAMPEP_0179128788 /NCGR_PEP_ID=MMETSP0796-20121207/61078_1 /TAXON_ID=73915 /ORGANISM="Pyrodinium bahamense, Strain pbaha01" /LENGTH=98 /DNA_ID=CAMNT_0020827645 /DNA_START=546 /DNA_END=839 /DNA_ORIENTATION=+